jgi:hypothetical protein
MDRMSAIKIAMDVTVEQIGTNNPALIGQVIQEILDTHRAR